MTRCAGLALAVVVVSAWLSGGVRATSAMAADIDLTAFANGALVERSTSEYGGGWEARWLTDENPATGWCSAEGAKGPFEIVFSLPDRSEVHAFEFDAAATDGVDRGARNIEVAVSDTSAAAGFSPVITVALKATDKQAFPLPKPVSGRWIRLTITSNQGASDFTELMEFRALGTPLTRTPMPSGLSGTYETERYGDFHLQQDGASLSGCYEHNEGLVHGGAESNLLRLTWHEGERKGPAIMVLRRDGKSFEGWWMDEGASSWHSGWDLKKRSETIGTCPNWNPKAAAGNIVATELAAGGRARLYGINFDVDSDRLRADAKPAVDQLISALKANPGWNVAIEGHTDSTGNAAHNLDLSRLRAQAVKAALVAGGIAGDRLTTSGLGQTKPLASNDTEAGRAQNRRVEVVRQ